MSLIFYGDSHTLGAEIDDHTILRKSFDEVNFQKKTLKKNSNWTQAMLVWNTQLASKMNKNLWDVSNRVSPHSFPKVVGRKLKRPTKVRAQTATSMEFLSLQLLTDYHSGEITTEDTIIVSLPRPTRSYSLNHQGNYDVKFLNLVGSLSAELRNNMIEAGVPEDLLIDTFLSDHRQVAEYYKNLANIMAWSSHKNLTLYFLHTIKPEYLRVDAVDPEVIPGVKTHCETDPDWVYRQFCLDTYKEMTKKLLIPEDMYSIAEPTELCGFHHPNADVHERFADLICEKLEV